MTNQRADARRYGGFDVIRIVAALSVVLSVVVLGPIMTTLPLHDYFASRRTALYLVRGVTLFGGSINALPGVFHGNPRHAVNGSLWTLSYEVWAYVALLVFAVCGGLRRRWLAVALFGAVLVFFRIAVYDGVGSLPIDRTVLTLSLGKDAELGAYFVAGTAISRFVVSFEPRRLALAGAAALVLGSLVREPAIFIPGVTLTVIGMGAAHGKLTDLVHRFGDPSYGIYILSFPIQQLVYSSGLARTPAGMFIASGALTVASGYLSWHLLERPMLRWAKRRDGHRLEVAAAG